MGASNRPDGTSIPLQLKPSRLQPLLQPLHAFLSAESAGGILLLIATLCALAWANSPWGHSYELFWHTKLGFEIGGFGFSMSLGHWVNDGLMAVFFLLVGLEIKREVLIGELASARRAALPVAAAVGGMIVPALIYFAFNVHGPGSRGWGIPMATDIAFAVGVLTLVGRSAPTSIKVFLLAVAIVDDLGAVLVIALFYTSHISLFALSIAGAFLAMLCLLNFLRVHHPLPYIILGLGLWGATLASGVHATIAGVLLAFTIPATRQIEEADYVAYAEKMLAIFKREAARDAERITDDQSHALKALEEASQAVQTPLARVEHGLLVPVTYLIVPLFALANAGVDMRSSGMSALSSPVAWGVLLGLLVGKPVGILLSSWIAWRVGIASMPDGVTWRQITGAAILCGIGFTMSLFVANLAFPDAPEQLVTAKLGILVASAIAGGFGGAVILLSRRLLQPATLHAHSGD